jgi:4-amino-4-deoxy-L-arabinose transferase-like glycosyltransferase
MQYSARQKSAAVFGLAMAILLLAAALRVYDLGGRDLWVDEANGVLMSQRSLPELFESLKLDSSPPLYYIILHVWMVVFGDSEAALRLISVVAGLALVACVFIAGRRLFSLEIGAIAAVLVAVSPIQVFYSQQARMYSLLAVVALLSFHWLWQAVTSGRRRFVVGYGLATLAALYVHNHGLYLLPAHAAVLIWSGTLRRKPGVWLVCAACIVIGYLPWLPTLWTQLQNPTHYSWFLPYWREYGPWGSLWRTLESFAPGGPQPAYVGLRGWAEGGHVAVAVIAVLAGLGILRVFVRSRADASSRAHAGLLLSFVLIPLVVALGASKLLTPNYVPGRCDQLVFPGFVLLVSVGIGLIRPVFVRYVVVAGLLVLSGFGLNQHYRSYPLLSDRAMAVEIVRRAQPGDAVLCTSLTRAPLEYYVRRFGAPLEVFSYPRDTAHHLGNQDDVALLRNPAALREEARLVEQDIKTVCGPNARFFLVMTQGRVSRFVHEALIASGRSRTLETVGSFTQAVTGQPVIVGLHQF